ncbi:MAG: hypothetical protein Q9177_001816, partial [Variospora cf. flavescens]
MATPTRPPVGRQSSRVPGGFDTDEDLSPTKTEYDHGDFDTFDALDERKRYTPSESQKRSPNDNPIEYESFMQPMSDGVGVEVAGEGDTIDEKEMRKKLMDMDSTFLPETSPAAPATQSGVDDTYIVGREKTEIKDHNNQPGVDETASDMEAQGSPATPSESYKTPAPGREEMRQEYSYDDPNEPRHDDTSALETMSSSPTAAAAARTVSRAVSSVSTGGYETADDTHESGVQLEYEAGTCTTDQEETPKKATDVLPNSSRDNSPTPTRPIATEAQDALADHTDHESRDQNSRGVRKRPAYLNSRTASQRSSYSSYTTTSMEGGSEATLGADYALQSGGAVPYGGSLNSRPSLTSRSVTLGSMASEITNLSDGEDKVEPSAAALDGLGTLDEEDEPSNGFVMTDKRPNDDEPHTPQGAHIRTPTETVIAQHVRDVQVPATMAREYQYRPGSPEKRNGGPTPSATRPGKGKSMTLKEQSTQVDKYMKLNWDLQLKITFLKQALNQRSDEGVKAMIEENVELNTTRVNLAKEIRDLKRSIRALERDLEMKNGDLAKMTKAAREAEDRAGPSPQELRDLETEVTYLRERVTTYEEDIEKLRHDSIRQDGEKRRMTEMLKSVSRRGGSDVGLREEIDYYRDELEAESARREQADEENRRLREENWRLQEDTGSRERASKNGRPGSSRTSQSGQSNRVFGLNGTGSAASSTLVEQLRHENAKLQRDMRAQESMLTSRNREKEHLYQEIEELKLAARRGDATRSSAGDSIFERSVSRAHRRATSRASEAPAMPQMGDVERESYEARNGELRDQVNAQKLEIVDITRQLEICFEELSQYDRLKADHDKLRQAFDSDLGIATEDLQTLQAERDEALQMQEQLDAELQEQKAQFEDAQAEAQGRFDELEDELDRRMQEMQRMENEISNQNEQGDALRAEVRNLSEKVVEKENAINIRERKLKQLNSEVEAMNNETDAIHQDRTQLRDQHERLTVQYESSQSQLAFLREEQDGDKIKIGELENSLTDTQAKLDNEMERAKDLDQRLAEERHQREVLGSKEKQEVQKMMNDLNREVTGAKDESRQLKETLKSTEIELTTWKERLTELENHLRETLGDSKGTRSTFLTSITKLQKELEGTSLELDNTRHDLAETERRLRDRDNLLEATGLEVKRLTDVVDRERQGRRQDKIQHEQWQKAHQHTSRTVTQKDVRISELESAKQSDRKKLQALESQRKEQLDERNGLLLTLWSRLSATCGPDWQHQHSLINGRVATLEVVASMLPAFSKTLLLAVQHIESIMVTFKTRVQTIERDLQTQYRTLEENLDDRSKKLEKLENIVQSNRIQGTFTAAPEIAKLRGENRLLKSEIAVFQNKEMRARSHGSSSSSRELTPLSPQTNNASAPPPSLARHHSSSVVEQYSQQRASPSRRSSLMPLPIPERTSVTSSEPNQSRWTHRLRELERRLKAEREARLLDRTGARKRLEEGMKENEDLKAELERERERRRMGRCGNIIGELPIHIACWGGAAAVVRVMLDAGVDIKARDLTYQETPLLKAANTGQTDYSWIDRQTCIGRKGKRKKQWLFWRRRTRRGAGSAGASAAYYLNQFQSPCQPINLTIYERNNYIGGRTTTVNAYDDPNYPVELGGSIFVKLNHNLVNAARAFNLPISGMRASRTPDPPDVLGIWDGERFVFTQSDASNQYWNIAKLLWEYGYSPIRTQSLMKKTVGSFLKMYNPPYFPFTSLSKTASHLDLLSTTAVTGERYLETNGISSHFAHDIIQASTRVNYAQNLDQIHGLETMVCMATDGAMSIEGGNWQIFASMIAASGAALHLNTSVTSVTKDTSSGKYTIETSTAALHPAQGISSSSVVEAT